MSQHSSADASSNRRETGGLSQLDGESGISDAARAASGYRYLVLVMLTITYAISLVDRQLIAIVTEPIRKDLQFSDTQIGLLSGLAFGLFYAAAAIPLSRIADSWSKNKLIALCFCLWSAAAAACGLAGSFTNVFIARTTTGVSEGGASSTSQALLADYFPPHQRATVLSR